MAGKEKPVAVKVKMDLRLFAISCTMRLVMELLATNPKTAR
jgi:hypothetical protein